MRHGFVDFVQYLWSIFIYVKRHVREKSKRKFFMSHSLVARGNRHDSKEKEGGLGGVEPRWWKEATPFSLRH
jgi:hypothetical protein